MKTETPAQAAVAEALARFGIAFEIASTAPNDGHGRIPIERDGWKCYSWRFTFMTAPGKGPRVQLYSSDYYTGTGHVVKPKHSFGMVRLAVPHAADVLHSLLLDSSACDQSFNDWCADYGSDPDSIKALKTYQACCDIGEHMRKMLTREQRAELQELLQDY